MCARTLLVTSSLRLVEFFTRLDPLAFGDLDPATLGDADHEELDWFNIAPTDPLAILRRTPEHSTGALFQADPYELSFVRWGMVPSYQWQAPRTKLRRPLINARDDSLLHKRDWKRPNELGRRCLVPVSGWYEWTTRDGAKIPHWFRPVNGELVALAGLWSPWKPPEPEVRPVNGRDWPLHDSATVMTVQANGFLARWHDRSPCVLPADQWARWLDPETSAEDARAMLQPIDLDAIEVVELDPRLGNVRDKDPAVRQVVGDPIRA